jgi:hypothetical protein
MTTISIPAATTGVRQALSAMNAYACLLLCIDEDKWASLARPEPGGLAAIAFTLTGTLESALSEQLELYPT